MARQVCEENKSRDMASSAGFCYSDNNTTMQTHLANQIQGCFVSDPEMFNLTAGMEMIGFHKNLQHQQQSDHSNAVIWKSFFAKPGQHQGEHLPPQQGPSSSKTMNHPSSSSSTNFYHEYNTSGGDQNLIVGGGTHDSVSATWQQDNRSLMVDDSSLRCVFPCEGNERPSQGLSLSLSSNNPSSIGLQSFELRQTTNHHQPQPPADHDFVSANPREGFFVKSANTHHGAQQQQQMLQQQDGYLSANKAAGLYHGGHFILKNSKYLVPAQELLNEFCSLESTKQGDDLPKQKSQKNKESWEEEDNNGSGSSSSKKHSLTSLELAEFQKRKTKLLSMLEEVDRRYRHYRNQMKAVVSSFEAVAGNGAATVYSALALRAMSRHFRCLKDGILGQIHATRKAMGEKDPVAPGTTRGETPRLKLIDQTLRQQRAFQQMNMMETHPWRPQRGLPERSVSLLRAWLFEHFLHPYPSDVDKHILARQTGLSRSQVSNWFINARVRLWKPMVEEMYLEEMKEHENNMASSEWGSDPEHVLENVPPHQDQKPNPERLLIRIDSECASSSIIINQDSTKNDPKSKTLNLNPQEQQCLGRVTDTSFGSVELDFSSYTSGMVSYGGGSSSNSGVSLTLGLQQHAAGGGSGVSLAFPPPTHQGSLLYQTRDQIEECQPVQYSLLDGEAQNLPYRNLMGAQLLHDLAG